MGACCAVLFCGVAWLGLVWRCRGRGRGFKPCAHEGHTLWRFHLPTTTGQL